MCKYLLLTFNSTYTVISYKHETIILAHWPCKRPTVGVTLDWADVVKSMTSESLGARHLATAQLTVRSNLLFCSGKALTSVNLTLHFPQTAEFDITKIYCRIQKGIVTILPHDMVLMHLGFCCMHAFVCTVCCNVFMVDAWDLSYQINGVKPMKIEQ